MATALAIRTPEITGAEARARRLAATALRDRLKLPPKVSGAEWADLYRYVSPPAAQPGPWRTERAPYLREILDVVCGREYQDITTVKCSQSGGSEVILNAIGYYVDQEPSSILAIQPNVKPMAEDFSKDRIAPMFRDSERLHGKVRDSRARDSGNTILHKEFAGGNLTIAGANSAAGLASRPIRIVLADELDRWGASAGTEGDPLSLAEARQRTYRHRAKRVKVSSPGNEGESRIEREWAASDQRHYYVPCPHCGHYQPLEWRDTGGKPGITVGRGAYRLVWEKDLQEGDEDDAPTKHRPETAKYQCRACEALIDETNKPRMLAEGRWVKHRPESKRAGFHIAGLLSPWVRWRDVAADWLRKKGDPEERKVFINTMLGLLYAEEGEIPGSDQLKDRREAWAAEVPAAVGVLTAAVDVQGDRLEVEVRGWCAGEESYLIRLARVYGEPQDAETWAGVEALLTREWSHESGTKLRIRAAMVDSGYETDSVYKFVRPRQGRRVYAYKGAENAKHPISRAERANADGVKSFTVNPTDFKDVLFRRLRRQKPGPGFLHFGTEAATGVDDQYFEQYGAEKRQVVFENNAPRVTYTRLPGRRNEAIDLYVMNLAALRSLGFMTSEWLGKIAGRLNANAKPTETESRPDAQPSSDSPPAAPPAIVRPAAPQRPRASSWVTGWRR